MSLQKAGASYDNEIAAQIDEVTDPLIRALPARGSGNTKFPQLDVLVRTPKGDHFMELKKSSIDRGDRTTVFKEDDLKQLSYCANPYTRVYVGISLSHCELLFYQLPLVGVESSNEDLTLSDDISKGDIAEGDEPPLEVAETIVSLMPECFDPNVTSAGNVSLRKPQTDDWPTSRSGREDIEVICEAIGLNYDEDC